MARAVLHLWSQRFELHAAERSRPSGSALRFDGATSALRWLRRAAADPAARALLRRFAIDSLGPPRATPLDDDDLLSELAGALAAGRLRLFEEPRLPLAAIPGDKAEEEPARTSEPRRPEAELTWITIELVGEDNKPIAGERYRIELPDGSTQEGSLDAEGLARVRGIEPGKCVVTFPDLDREAWLPIGTTGEP